MNQKLTNFAVITIVAVAAVVFARTFVSATFEQNNTVGTIIHEQPKAETADLASESKIITSRPVKIEIQSIGVNAKIEKVGILESGAMGIPSTFKTVGWYANGTKPGNPGTAYLDGHVDNGLGLDGVFKRLDEISMNDPITITLADGERLKFEVISLAEYEYDASDIMTEQHAEDGNTVFIKLITCGGKWLKESQTYDKRIVVTAALVTQ